MDCFLPVKWEHPASLPFLPFLVFVFIFIFIFLFLFLFVFCMLYFYLCLCLDGGCRLAFFPFFLFNFFLSFPHKRPLAICRLDCFLLVEHPPTTVPPCLPFLPFPPKRSLLSASKSHFCSRTSLSLLCVSQLLQTRK